MVNSFRLTSLFIGLVAFLASCEKPADAPAEKAARAEITITNYYNESGAKNIKSWENSDVVAIFNASDASASVSQVKPISPGTQTSRFIYSTNAANGDNIVAYYPAASGSLAEGKIMTSLSASQNAAFAPFYVGNGKFVDSSQSLTRITLNPLWCTVYVTIPLGDYSVTKAVITGNNGEKLAGTVTVDPSDMSVDATETSVTHTFSTPKDCRTGAAKFSALIAPVTFAKGFKVTCHTEAGAEFVIETGEKVEAKAGEKITAGGASDNGPTELLVCGDNMIYHIDADIAVEKGFNAAVLWQWDSKTAMGTIGKDGLRLDECKPVDNNTKILVTSSRGFALLLEKATKKVLWWSNVSTNAHSAELLPNNRIAIACSENGDEVQIFDLSTPNKVICSTPLPYAHGVLWNEKHQKLYAIGNNDLRTYSLKDWDTASPSLVLEKTVDTYGKAWGLHDLSYVNDDTILISGNKAGFYDVVNDKFVPLGRFQSSNGIKAVNYNSETGDCWYVDATKPEGDFAWSSKTIHYTDDVNSSSPDLKTITNVPINMYKVRVLNW